ncbi:MAG: PIN domain-containing protein [Terrimicrobiaceae bacterium]|nr:PIN domain-containing protein [Terrimicrobiaceae bacterium]
MILDTNALSAWADGLPSSRPAFASATRLVVPVIVLGEYQFGIRQSRHRARYEQWLLQNLRHAEIAAVTDDLAGIYADLRLHLKSNGTPIPANDVWIAALTLKLDLPLLSNDSHFDLVPGLQRLSF